MGDGTTNEPLAGVQIGYWYKGTFMPIKDAVTDKNGKVSFTLPEDTYILTAKGNVKIVNPWTSAEVTTQTMAPYCLLTVKPASIKNATVKVNSATYTGKARTPAVTVTLDGKTLTKGTDYTVKYSNNIKAGTSAKVTVTGTGKYGDSVTANFTIKKAAQKLTLKKSKLFKKNNLVIF